MKNKDVSNLVKQFDKTMNKGAHSKAIQEMIQKANGIGIEDPKDETPGVSNSWIGNVYTYRYNP